MSSKSNTAEGNRTVLLPLKSTPNVMNHFGCTSNWSSYHLWYCKGASTLLGYELVFVLRLMCIRKCGRFHEPKQRDQLEPCARAVRYSVGRAVCTHRQQSDRARAVWTHLNTTSDYPCSGVSSNTALAINNNVFWTLSFIIVIILSLVIYE
jgi:hypothetical protein